MNGRVRTNRIVREYTDCRINWVYPGRIRVIGKNGQGNEDCLIITCDDEETLEALAEEIAKHKKLKRKILAMAEKSPR